MKFLALVGDVLQSSRQFLCLGLVQESCMPEIRKHLRFECQLHEESRADSSLSWIKESMGQFVFHLRSIHLVNERSIHSIIFSTTLIQVHQAAQIRR